MLIGNMPLAAAPSEGYDGLYRASVMPRGARLPGRHLILGARSLHSFVFDFVRYIR